MDDVTDVAIRVVGGANFATAGDNVNANDLPLLDVFPFLSTPWDGLNRIHQNPAGGPPASPTPVTTGTVTGTAPSPTGTVTGTPPTPTGTVTGTPIRTFTPTGTVFVPTVPTSTGTGTPTRTFTPTGTVFVPTST